MTELQLLTKDEPGVLGRLAEVLGAASININTLSIESRNGEAVIHLVTSNNEQAKQVLASKEYQIIENNALVIRMQDKPGELAKVGKMLGDEQINITDLYLLKKEDAHSYFALTTTDNKKSSQILREFL